MSTIPASIPCCRHIKTNGVQCGSPAIRNHNYCYFHVRWHRKGPQVESFFQENPTLVLPSLEDANSIQMGLADIIRDLTANLLDHKTARLMLYALQIASSNVKHTCFEPNPAELPPPQPSDTIEGQTSAPSSQELLPAQSEPQPPQSDHPKP